jgi:hypothetical protein
MGKKSSAPPPDPRMFEVAMRQVEQGDEMIRFLKDSWAANQPRLDKQDALNEQVIGQNMRLAQSAEDRANDSYSFYKEQGRPVISQALKDAQDWDSDENIEQARGQASADIQSSMDKQQESQNRMLTRMGINPNSSKFAQLNQQMSAQTALAQAGGMNQAAEGRKLQAVGMRQQAGNLASGMPAQSMGFSGQAGGMGAQASGIGAAGMAGRLAAQGQHMSGMGQAGNMFGSAGNTMGNYHNAQMSAHSSNQQAASSAASGLGSLAGMAMMAFADGGNVGKGGRVVGPGTGISDDVPAQNRDTGQRIQLSNGEYIIPADVVRKVGEDKFDQLLAKYHTPAAQQRKGNLSGAR